MTVSLSQLFFLISAIFFLASSRAWTTTPNPNPINLSLVAWAFLAFGFMFWNGPVLLK